MTNPTSPPPEGSAPSARQSGSSDEPRTGRSWSELIDTLHGGIALVGEDWDQRYASARFVTFPSPAGPLDIDLGDVVRVVCRNGPPGLLEQLDRGDAVNFEHRLLDAHHELRWIRITVVPCDGLGDGIRAVVFAKDTTSTSQALHQLRATTSELTEIEEVEHRRLSRELHDGPIQLLGALLLRLELAEQTAAAQQLLRVANSVGAQLRSAVTGLSDDRSENASAVLERWIRPFVATSRIDLDITDQLQAQPSRMFMQSIFVFLHEVVRTALDVTFELVLRVAICDERDGYRMTCSLASPGEPDASPVPARLSTMFEYVRVLGGSLTTEGDERGGHALSVWLPRLTDPDLDAALDTPHREAVADTPLLAQARRDPLALPALDDATWQCIFDAAPERMMELGANDEFLRVNDAQVNVFGVPREDLVGRDFKELFAQDSLERLAPHFDRLDNGELIDVQWERPNIFDEMMKLRITISPRFDAGGKWAGGLVVVDDLSDLRVLGRLHESALADFAETRRLARHTRLAGLNGPLSAVGDLIDLLQEHESTGGDGTTFRAIRLGLQHSLPMVKNSLSVLAAPDLSRADLGSAVRSSVESLLSDVRLDFVGEMTAPPPADVAEAIFRISREAVINAVNHGGASVITMTVRDGDGAIRVEVQDNGTGIQPGDLDPRPGHIGTRAMMERAREHGGTCRIEPGPEGGTCVSVMIPPPGPIDTMLMATAGQT